MTRRLALHYWRSPGYIYAKILLTFGSALFIGLSLLNLPNTQVGVRIQTIAVFMFLTTHLNLLQQIVPVFVAQRTLYEGREQPSRTYSWAAFMAGQIVVEMAYNALMAPPAFFAWYYLVGLYRNAAETGETAPRGGLAFLFMLVFFLNASTFAHMLGAAFQLADQAAGIGNLLFVMMFIFNGILSDPPRFWVWMYRVNPFTYLVEGLLGTGLANAGIHCAENEFLRMSPPPGRTCGQYLQPFVTMAGGYIADPAATQNCGFCATSNTNQVLAGVKTNFNNRWRDLGIMFAYVFFNVVAAFALYYTRVPKHKKDKGDKSSASGQDGTKDEDLPTPPWQDNSEKLAVNSMRASKARKTHVLGSIRSSINGGIQVLGGGQVLPGGAKRYWDDDADEADDKHALRKLEGDEEEEIGLGFMSDGEDTDGDIPIGDFTMQRPTPQFWI